MQSDEIDQAIGQAVDQAVYEAVNHHVFVQSGLTTVIIVVGLLVLRFMLVHFIRGDAEILDQEQRRWINRINNGSTILIVVSLIFVWAPQIHTFALSLTAVAVAVVLTTKELLMCLTGGFLRASTKAFDVGDWIKVDGVVGEVMSITSMTTLIEELDMGEHTYHFTGRTVQIPNSKFLTVSIENQNFIKNHIYYDVPITVQYADLDPSVMMQELKNITEKHYGSFREDATKYNKRIEKQAAVDFSDPEPQFFLRTTDIGHNTYTVRIFVPTRQARQIAANITQDFLSFAFKEKAKSPENEKE